MATTPKITTALNYIKDTTLPLINATGKYALSLASPSIISRDFVGLDKIKPEEFPSVFIMSDGPNVYSPMTGVQYATGGAFDDITTGYNVRILGYVKVTEPGAKQKTGALTDVMDQLIGDIILAMHSDRTLGGNVHVVTLLASDKSLEHWQQNQGVVEVWFALKYDFDPTSSAI